MAQKICIMIETDKTSRMLMRVTEENTDVVENRDGKLSSVCRY